MRIGHVSVEGWERGRIAAAVCAVYLVAVAGSYLFVLADLASPDRADASLSGVWPYLLTVPLSLLAILLIPDSHGAFTTTLFAAAPAVCALLQACGLWFVLRGRRRTDLVS